MYPRRGGVSRLFLCYKCLPRGAGMGRMGRGHAGAVHQTPPDMTGRWGLSPIPTADPTSRSVALGEAWLDRYGVVTRGAVQSENILGGFALAYKVLSGFEESGKALRGHFITDLGAAQFATAVVIDRLRGFADTDDVTGWPSGTSEPNVCVIAACDPANPYGAALPWPGDGKSPSTSPGAVKPSHGFRRLGPESPKKPSLAWLCRPYPGRWRRISPCG